MGMGMGGNGNWLHGNGREWECKKPFPHISNLHHAILNSAQCRYRLYFPALRCNWFFQLLFYYSINRLLDYLRTAGGLTLTLNGTLIVQNLIYSDPISHFSWKFVHHCFCYSVRKQTRIKTVLPPKVAEVTKTPYDSNFHTLKISHRTLQTNI